MNHIFIKKTFVSFYKGFFYSIFEVMSLAVKGKIQQILKPQSGTSQAGKEWNKQEFVIETEEQYPRKVCFTLFGEKTSLINGLSVGDEVEVSFNLESREYNGRWFHNVNAWKIDKPSVGNISEPPPEFGAGDIPPEPAEDAASDLPF